MTNKESKSTTDDMDEDNLDLSTINEIEVSGDPKRDKVRIIFLPKWHFSGPRTAVQGAASAKTRRRKRTGACCIHNRVRVLCLTKGKGLL